MAFTYSFHCTLNNFCDDVVLRYWPVVSNVSIYMYMEENFLKKPLKVVENYLLLFHIKGFQKSIQLAEENRNVEDVKFLAPLTKLSNRCENGSTPILEITYQTTGQMRKLFRVVHSICVSELFCLGRCNMMCCILFVWRLFSGGRSSGNVW